jgi:hypothetical protein
METRSGPPGELIFRLPKKSLGVRVAEPVSDLLDPLSRRAGDCGCGKVARDELVAALLLAGARMSADELRGAIDTYRRSRAGDLDVEAEPSVRHDEPPAE